MLPKGAAPALNFSGSKVAATSQQEVGVAASHGDHVKHLADQVTMESVPMRKMQDSHSAGRPRSRHAQLHMGLAVRQHPLPIPVCTKTCSTMYHVFSGQTSALTLFRFVQKVISLEADRGACHCLRLGHDWERQKKNDENQCNASNTDSMAKHTSDS